MSTLLALLREHCEEFEAHFAMAVALEGRIFSGDDVSIGSLRLSSRHLLTVKSGLIIHLYNIVESTMWNATNLIGTAFGAVEPSQWTERALREWLRKNAVARIDGNEDARLQTVHEFSSQLLLGKPLGPQELKKPSGTWTDKNIAEFAKRLGVSFRLNEELGRCIASRPEFGDQSPLEFLADRRNALAHGRRSFEDGAKDLTLAQIRELADACLKYVDAAAAAFQNYVDGNHFVIAR